MIMNLDKIVAQVERWRNQIPDVEIFYSVKTNPNPVLLKVLKLLGVNFDCASSFELDLIARELKNPVESIVYSHPCKLSSHLQHADKLGVSLTVADNEEELDKIKLYAPHAQVLIRLAVDDSSAASPMSSKFGAAMEQVPLLLKGALQRGVAVAGVSFHVGNGCRNASAFQAALARARVAMEAGLDAGHDMHILDIGGGFPILGADGDCRHGDASFEDMAREIRTALDDQFPGRAILGRVRHPRRHPCVSLLHQRRSVRLHVNSPLRARPRAPPPRGATRRRAAAAGPWSGTRCHLRAHPGWGRRCMPVRRTARAAGRGPPAVAGHGRLQHV